jgi:hypothetical protein
MAPGGTVGGSSVHSLQKHAGEQGRAVGRRRHSAAGLTGGTGRQWGLVVRGGVWEEERRAM